MKIQSKILSLKDGRAVTLRSAIADDAKALLAHLTITHSESYKNLNSSAERWKNFSIDEEAKILKDFEKADNKFMVVALSENRIIGGLGFVGSFFEFSKHSASIGMSIQQEFANVGLGKGILEYALEAGKIHGFRRVELTVRAYNLAGIALYEKVGFKRIGLLKDMAFIDGQYVDEYSYQIIL